MGALICTMLFAIPLILGAIPVAAQDAGGRAPSAVGRVGQRQTRADAAISIVTSARISSRIENRIQSRLRTRIDPGYDPHADAKSLFEDAAGQARITRR